MGNQGTAGVYTRNAYRLRRRDRDRHRCAGISTGRDLAAVQGTDRSPEKPVPPNLHLGHLARPAKSDHTQLPHRLRESGWWDFVTGALGIWRMPYGQLTLHGARLM